MRVPEPSVPVTIQLGGGSPQDLDSGAVARETRRSKSVDGSLLVEELGLGAGQWVDGQRHAVSGDSAVGSRSRKAATEGMRQRDRPLTRHRLGVNSKRSDVPAAKQKQGNY